MTGGVPRTSIQLDSTPPLEVALNYPSSRRDGAATDGLQQIVDGLATRLGRSVAVDDTRGRVVTVSRHFGDEDPLRVYAVLQRDSDPRVMAHFRAHGIYDWTAPGRVPASSTLDFKARVCCPARAHGMLLGHLFLIDDDVRDWEVELAAGAAAEVGLLMYRRVVLHERTQARREELARALVSDSATERARARQAAAGELGLDAADPVVAVVIDLVGPGGSSGPGSGGSSTSGRSSGPGSGESDGSSGSGSSGPGGPAEAETALRAAIERTTRDRVADRSVAAVDGRRAVVLLVGDAASVATARDLADRMVAELDGRRDRPVIGIGGPCAGADAAWSARAGAQLAAHAAALLPFLGDVVDSDGLDVYGLLLRLPRSELTEARLPEGLRLLIARDPGGVLVDTLEAYLDQGGDATRTAERLRIHRSTLYYRLGRIETFTGLRLRDGRSRLSLHVGIALLRVLEAYREHPELLPEP